MTTTKEVWLQAGESVLKHREISNSGERRRKYQIRVRHADDGSLSPDCHNFLRRNMPPSVIDAP